MAANIKKVECFTVNLRSNEEILFENLITNPDYVEQEFRIKGKDVSLRILENKRNTIVGLVEVSRNENIPPKKNRKEKRISKLGLENEEGLAYANVFIYEKKRKVLMYEVNKFGCYIEHFLLYLYKCYKAKPTIEPFDVSVFPILKSNEYERMLNMNFYKSLEIHVANPKKIMSDYKHKNDALFNVCDSASKVGSTKVSTKFEVSARGKTNGLLSRSIKSIVDSALIILRGPNGDNIKRLRLLDMKMIMKIVN